MCLKEEVYDYCYFFDFDLLFLEIEQVWVDQIVGVMLELFDEKKVCFVKDLGLLEYDVGVLIVEVENVDYFEVVVSGCDGKMVVNWVINELFGWLNKEGLMVEILFVSVV